MSFSLGAQLPSCLLERLEAQTSPTGDDEAILIATIDDAGRPHPALLSPAELLAVDAHRLRLATYRDSHTAANLRQRGTLTLCLVGPAHVHYVKAHARESERKLESHSHLAVFEAVVEDVLEDRPRKTLEGSATVLTGITFRRPEPAGAPLRTLMAAL